VFTMSVSIPYCTVHVSTVFLPLSLVVPVPVVAGAAVVRAVKICVVKRVLSLMEISFCCK